MSKCKVLTISDHPLVSSGVGIQTRYVIEGLLNTGRYQVRSIGAALSHKDYRPQKITQYGDDWIIYPTNGYGDPNILRQLLDVEHPDALYMQTDPRFFQWLFDMSDEIRNRGIPILYNTIWDNKPSPIFNKVSYDSCDFLGCISKVTYDIACDLGLKHKAQRIPHAVDMDSFKFLGKSEILDKKAKLLGKNKDKFVLFYCGRNARRKMTSDVLKTFKQFLDNVGQDKAFLLMQTSPLDKEGANLIEVAKMLGLNEQQVSFSLNRVPTETLVDFYNISDSTVCLSNAEGFGLTSLESLACGTPVISVRTGGLQEQNRNPETGEEFGVSIQVDLQSLAGSQAIPYIYEDRCLDVNVVNAYKTMYDKTFEERLEIGLKGREYVKENYRLDSMVQSWDEAFTKYVELYKAGNPDRIKVVKV